MTDRGGTYRRTVESIPKATEKRIHKTPVYLALHSIVDPLLFSYMFPVAGIIEDPIIVFTGLTGKAQIRIDISDDMPILTDIHDGVNQFDDIKVTAQDTMQIHLVEESLTDQYSNLTAQLSFIYKHQ